MALGRDRASLVAALQLLRLTLAEACAAHIGACARRYWHALAATWQAHDDAVVRALRSTVGPAAHALGAGRWANGDALTQGEAVTHRVTLRAYVSETAPTVATVTAVAFDTSGATAGDGVIFVPSDNT